MHARNIAILLANGSHARLLRRDHETGEFRAIAAVDDGPHGRSLGPGRAGDDERVQRRRVHAFLEVIAEHLRHAIQTASLHGVVVAAPTRILGDLNAMIDPICPVLASVQKDLIKANDHELPQLLTRELFQAEGGLPASV